MARARNIKPGFYKNEELAECSLMARFIFPGLWMIADREGRLEDRPKRIKGELLPYDNADMDKLLDELAAWGLIVRYQVNGERFISIPKFLTHQNPHHRETESTFPPPQSPGLNGDGTHSKPQALGPCEDIKASEEPEASHEKASPSRADSLIPESPILNPESSSSSDDGRDDDRPAQEAPLPPRENPVPSPDPAVQLSVYLRKLGVNALFTHPAVQDWSTRKVPLEILDQAVVRAREAKGPTAKIPPNYLVNIVEELLNPPAKAEAAPAKQREDYAWASSNQGIDAKARELRIRVLPSHTYADVKQMCFDEIRRRKAQAPKPEGAAA